MKPALIIVTDEAAELAAASLLANGAAYAVVRLEDVADGVVSLAIQLARGHEHRRADVETMVREGAAQGGLVVVDAASVGRAGAA